MRFWPFRGGQGRPRPVKKSKKRASAVYRCTRRKSAEIGPGLRTGAEHTSRYAPEGLPDAQQREGGRKLTRHRSGPGNFLCILFSFPGGPIKRYH